MNARGPFRAEDLEARARVLYERRDALARELRRLNEELAAHRPWSAGRFAAGFGLVVLAAVLVLGGAWLFVFA